MFISATSLFSHSYEARNKSKAQAFNEFSVFSCVALTALLSGWMELSFGWQAMNLYVMPFVVAVAVLFFVQMRREIPAQEA